MKLSACITINDRPIEVLEPVFLSMKIQEHDELIIVLDRTPSILANYCKTYWTMDRRVKFVEITGAPGWRSPVKAWNRGFEAVTGDILYCFSSETIQDLGNIARARTLMNNKISIQGSAECSCGPGGTEVNWNGTAPGNLLCDASHPRPLGFIWTAPTKNVRSIGGYDEEFDNGLWYDDADFFLRLWKSGLDFIFDDSIHGVHLHHERPGLEIPEGQAKIKINRAWMQQKHGTIHPWSNLPKIVTEREGQTRWEHV